MMKPFIMSAIASAASFAEMRVFMIVSSKFAFTGGPPAYPKQEPCQARRSVKYLFLKELFSETLGAAAADTVRGQCGQRSRTFPERQEPKLVFDRTVGGLDCHGLGGPPAPRHQLIGDFDDCVL